MVAAMTAGVLLAMESVATAGAAGQIKRGGSLTVLESGTQWPNLDPALDAQDTADATMLDQIYGQLLEVGPNGTFVPDLATGYHYSNSNLTLNLTIRKGVKFSDGTPFSAAAVAASMNRVLSSSFSCICDANFKDVTSIVASGNTVELNLAKPSAIIVESIVGEGPDWTIPPDALSSETEATFEQSPFGAGPFKVVSNIPSSVLTLTRNSDYWAKGEPYLGTLIFQSVAGGDQAANYAFESGSGQVLTGLSTPSIISGDKAQYHVTELPGSANKAITYNPNSAPFNNILAREAVAYATNGKVLLNALAPRFGTVGESEATPADLYYQAIVPGYQAYNLAKAKSLVQQLGGLSFTLVCNGGSSLESELCVALQSQLANAGITMNPTPVPLATYLSDVAHKTYQAFLNDVGGFDPDVGVQGLPSDFSSTGSLSGYTDGSLDGLINKTEAFVSAKNRQIAFDVVYAYIAKQAYADVLFAVDGAVVADKNVVGIEYFSGPQRLVNFEAVYVK